MSNIKLYKGKHLRIEDRLIMILNLANIAEVALRKFNG